MSVYVTYACLLVTCHTLGVFLQEHAERPEVVQRLIADAQVLVQQAQQLDVRLDKDVNKLQVSCLNACLPLMGLQVVSPVLMPNILHTCHASSKG